MCSNIERNFVYLYTTSHVIGDVSKLDNRQFYLPGEVIVIHCHGVFSMLEMGWWEKHSQYIIARVKAKRKM